MSETETSAGGGYIDHELLEGGVVEHRMYQLQLSSAALAEPSLVVLPTGAGKTTVALLVTAARLNREGGRSLFLAPTKPLVEQHASFYREALDVPDDEIRVFTGDVRPDDRADEWEGAKVVIATPQVVENDLIAGRIDLDDVTHLTFDECHRATGDYAYNYIADKYVAEADDPLVTGMTASPGSDKDEILEVCDNIGVSNVEILTEDDPSLAEYTHETEVDWREVEVPEDVLEARDLLNEVVRDRMNRLKRLGAVDKARADVSMKKLLSARGDIQEMMDAGESAGYTAMSVHAEVMKLRHAVEIVETQGVETLVSYFEKLENEARSSGGSKAVKRLMGESKVQEAREIAEEYDGVHPKMDVLRSLVFDELSSGEDARVIVFTEYRDTASTLVDFLDAGDARPVRFVGQANKEGDPGLTQKQQQEVLGSFREGEENVLVATSVAEEGLDIPEVDLVVFYEPVPSEIRAIQRRGRTGRERAGRVVVLIAEDTRDEAYFWSARRKEDRMEREINELKGVEDEINDELDESQRALGEFDADGEGAETENGEADETDDAVTVVADQRETKSNVVRELDTSDIDVELETLDVGDYVLSDRVAVERKSVQDFVDTLTGGRSLFEQTGDLSSSYSRPLLVLEGEREALYSTGVHKNAVRGALASVVVDYGVPVLFTADEDETAETLGVVARREQEESDREVRVHGEKSSATLTEQQEYVVSSIADVGPVTARALLDEFGSVEDVMTADEDALRNAEGVGEKTAGRIREVVGSGYEGGEG
ncbi:DEAD/DEAH box helicase [Haladaptatus sp. F3-133]|jgi:ERCC4-related helicase|uniref:DEAD/DEAH box helicase n=1 Tax=Halorutilus salinus TaxID=2487751 RepID=A0A9Q4GJK4_9EURY|nr:DEAD/DEAH box helicase [Halorutilus salinus]MCX2820013.1 DEAD/DEAH box helicase [Halorutilus salinus]